MRPSHLKRSGDAYSILRKSVNFARLVATNGGHIQPLAKGHAEIIDEKGNAVGYITHRQLLTYYRLYDNGLPRPDAPTRS